MHRLSRKNWLLPMRLLLLWSMSWMMSRLQRLQVWFELLHTLRKGKRLTLTEVGSAVSNRHNCTEQTVIDGLLYLVCSEWWDKVYCIMRETVNTGNVYEAAAWSCCLNLWVEQKCILELESSSIKTRAELTQSEVKNTSFFVNVIFNRCPFLILNCILIFVS